MEATTQTPAISDEAARPLGNGRFAAGEDPAKREQIIDGAKRAFMKLGFDAASMNDVRREAGVSKGTIYVYFQNKEDLFAALIEREKGKFTRILLEIFNDDDDVGLILYHYGIAFNHQILDTDFISALRAVLGVLDRMPNLCQSFFASSPANAKTLLKDYLERQRAKGRLDIADTDLASRQFIELATGSFFKRKLLGEIQIRPPESEIEYIVKSGVDVFLSAYGKNKG